MRMSADLTVDICLWIQRTVPCDGCWPHAMTAAYRYRIVLLDWWSKYVAPLILLPRRNNVSAKSSAAVNPHEPKSCEARFWLVSFEMCQTALTTDRQAMLVHIVNHSRLNTWRYRLYMRQNMRPLVRQYVGILDGRLFIIQAMYAMTRLAWTISQHWSLNLKSLSLSRIVFHYDNVQQNSTSRLLLYF